jgi:hypothetical protein
VEPGESVGNASWAVFHVGDDEVVAEETSDLGKGRGEAEEEETVQAEKKCNTVQVNYAVKPETYKAE